MPERKYSVIPKSREWLRAESGDRVVMFALPPIKGTHEECYKSIAKEKPFLPVAERLDVALLIERIHTEKYLVPAEGIDLALLTEGILTQEGPQWQSIAHNFLVNGIRTPNRALLIPAPCIKGDSSLEGVLVERDTEGNGLDTEMQVPDLSSWKQNDAGIYVPNDTSYEAVFVPSTAYKGKSFEKDGVVHAYLTPEGAEIFAKTANDKGKGPYNWLPRIMEVMKTKGVNFPIQRTSLLHAHNKQLYLGEGILFDGSHIYCGQKVSYAFGVLKEKK